MKNRLLCCLLFPVMVFAVVISGCGGNENLGESIENADLLALSYERLENADLSFNFNVDISEKSKDKVNKPARSGVSAVSDKMQRDSSDDYSVYEIIPSDYDGYKAGKTDYFESNRQTLERIRKNAREIADYAVDNITVMNTVVYRGQYDNYIMDYNSVDDLLTVTKFSYMNDVGSQDNQVSELKRIKIYYDGDGDETVEMLTYNLSNSGICSVCNAIYTADKYYYLAESRIENSSGNENFDGTYSLNVAFNTSDGWRGVKTHFTKNNPYLTGQGTYNYANGLIYMTFLIEHEGVMYSLTDKLVALRDGVETGSGVEASLDDEIILKGYSDGSPEAISVSIHGSVVIIPLHAIKGWNKVVFNGYYDRGNSYGYEFDSEDDIITLSDGTELSYNSVWSKEYGLLTLDRNTGNYYDKNQTQLSWSDINWNEAFKISVNDSVSLSNGTPIKSNNGALNFSFQDSSELPDISLLNKCFADFGLSYKNDAAVNTIDSLSYLEKNKQLFTAEIFENLFDKEYSETEIKSVFASIVKELDSINGTSINSYVDKFDKTDFNSMPQKPENIGLINLADNISGEAELTKEGLDFSDVKATVNKSVILSDGSKYVVVTGWSSGSGTLFADAFNTAVYDGNAMTFEGKSSVALPQSVVGEYTLKAFFGKVTNGGYIRLSDIVSVSVKQFEQFETRFEAEGGYYLNKYYKEGNDVKLKVTFVEVN